MRYRLEELTEWCRNKPREAARRIIDIEGGLTNNLVEYTVTDAAKTYGKQRKQLYRHMKSGLLPYREREDGRRLIRQSDLNRCYGAR